MVTIPIIAANAVMRKTASDKGVPRNTGGRMLAANVIMTTTAGLLTLGMCTAVPVAAAVSSALLTFMFLPEKKKQGDAKTEPTMAPVEVVDENGEPIDVDVERQTHLYKP